MHSVSIRILGLALLATLPALAALATLAAAARAADDPHALFEDRCGRCHGHAGPFVATAVVLKDGQAVTRGDGTPLAAFLPDHRGQLAPDQVAVLTEHLTSVAQRGGLFRDKCGACHETARQVAHDWLITRDGRVMGRYTGNDMADFLTHHGRANTAEAATLLAMLREQLDALGQ